MYVPRYELTHTYRHTPTYVCNYLHSNVFMYLCTYRHTLISQYRWCHSVNIPIKCTSVQNTFNFIKICCTVTSLKEYQCRVLRKIYTITTPNVKLPISSLFPVGKFNFSQTYGVQNFFRNVMHFACGTHCR